jgi:signal transduction histidine kinase
VDAVREILEVDAAAQRCLQDVVAHGEIVEWPRVAGEDGAPEDDHARRFPLTAALGANSAFVLPLPARDAMSGAVAVLRIAGRPPASASDLTLARLVALRAALALDNARLYGELQAALVARDALAASVTHDLRSPLGMIRLGVQSADMMLGDAEVADRQQLIEAQDALKQVDDVAVRMDSFIQELLDLAVLESGTRLTLRQEPIDLVALVRAAVAAQALAGRAVNLDAPSGPIVGRWDRLRLQRVIDNLASNAAKYSPREGAIHVRVALERQPTGAWAVLAIQDQGVGIPSSELRRVCERFFRGSNVQGSVPGTGLGLYGARQIVEQHGGTLSLDSQEGVGTTVTVRLPVRVPRCTGASPA